MKKKFTFTAAAFVLITAILSVGSIIAPDKGFSDNENRVLESFPTVSIKAISDGSFTEKLNAYASDNMIFRDEFIALKSSCQAVAGVKEIGGAYLLKNGGYAEKPQDIASSEEIFKNNADAVESFMARIKDIEKSHKTVMIVPTVTEIYPELLPSGATVLPQDELISYAKNTVKSADFADVTDLFKKSKKEKLYYLTDHHWTTDGAKVAYDGFLKLKGMTDTAVYRRETVTDKFRGTLYSKTLIPFSPFDEVVAYRTDNDENYMISDGESPTAHSIYYKENAEKKDAYTYFCGNNRPLFQVTYGKGKGHLLLIKDSYANCFLPFLMNNFATVTMVDLRYCTESAETLIMSQGITDILLLYNASSFASDRTPTLLGGQ